MKCRRVQQLLPDYIGDELSAQKRQQVDGHLTECQGCREALRQLHEVWDGFTQQPLPEKNERFWEDLTKGVMTEMRRNRPMPADEQRTPLFSGWRVLVVPATAAAIAILVGMIAFRGVLWGPQGDIPWTARGDQNALVAAPPDLSFGPLTPEVEDPLGQEITLQEVSLVAETLITSLQPAEGTAITDLATQLHNGEDLYGQLQGLTEAELEELDQLLSANYPYS
jgi:hypothetical protein